MVVDSKVVGFPMVGEPTHKRVITTLMSGQFDTRCSTYEQRRGGGKIDVYLRCLNARKQIHIYSIDGTIVQMCNKCKNRKATTLAFRSSAAKSAFLKAFWL